MQDAAGTESQSIPAAANERMAAASALHQQGEISRAAVLYREALRIAPKHFEALFRLAVVELQSGNLTTGADLLRQSLEINPRQPVALANLGMVLLDLGNPAEALTQLDLALQLAPDFPQALFVRADILRMLGRSTEALAGYDRLLASVPGLAVALSNRGCLLRELRRLPEALASLDAAVQAAPDNADAHYNRATVLLDLKRPADALVSLDAALHLQPEEISVLTCRGDALRELGRVPEALESYDRALALDGRYVAAVIGRGNAFKSLHRPDDALASYSRALELAPMDAIAHTNYGNGLSDLERHAEALASFDHALALDGDLADAWSNRGCTQRKLSRNSDALASFDEALRREPRHPAALFNRGSLLRDLQRLPEACESLRKLMEVAPDHPDGAGELLFAKLLSCDWNELEKATEQASVSVRGGSRRYPPLVLLALCESPEEQLRCARAYAAEMLPSGSPHAARFQTNGNRSERVRIAYLCAHFHAHPVAYSIVDVLERHDRSRFEVIGVSLGSDDRSEIRARVAAAFDRFHDMHGVPDAQIAQFLRDLQTDIVIDLDGYTGDARPRILAHRPAPVQVSYLGFASTMGTAHVDYVLADRVVVPPEHAPYFQEKIAWLPRSYFPSDSRRARPEGAGSRRDHGLPEDRFVFCGFNNPFKLNPWTFDLWAGLLREVEGSVLWLQAASSSARDNLRREARFRGVEPDRLVFANRVERMSDHLARQGLADLFLDTLPYNAHTTANDALFAGLPVITCMGNTFAGRVAASLLQAAGLPELVTRTPEGYRDLALELATSPTRLHDLRAKLANQRSGLFDTDRLRREIEAAYVTMCERSRRGESPQSFEVRG